MRRRGITSFCLALAIGAALLRVCPATAQLANSAPAWFLIGVQKANSSSSLQFTGANWSTNYNTLFLNCEGLFGSATGETLAVEVGESSPVTWETGAHYVVSNTDVANSTDVTNGQMLGMTTTGAATYMQIFIDNPGSSSIKKMIAVNFGGGNTTTNGNTASTCCGYNTQADTGHYGYFYVTGWWGSDTNALTGIELVPSSGTITSGTCSLYGIQ